MLTSFPSSPDQRVGPWRQRALGRLPSTRCRCLARWFVIHKRRRSGWDGAAGRSRTGTAPGCGMAQCSSVARSLDRWWMTRPCRCTSPLPPFRAALPRRRLLLAERNVTIICCASVPRELGTAAEAAELPLPPVVVEGTEEEAVACEECGDMGWTLCDFCKGKKNNVKSEGTRVYRRCPTCKAAGFILCKRCRVFKCITFPESNES